MPKKKKSSKSDTVLVMQAFIVLRADEGEDLSRADVGDLVEGVELQWSDYAFEAVDEEGEAVAAVTAEVCRGEVRLVQLDAQQAGTDALKAAWERGESVL